MAFTGGSLVMLGPKHFCEGTYTIDGTKMAAETVVRPLQPVDGNGDKMPKSMFRNVEPSFTLMAAGNVPTHDIAVGDFWIKEQPEVVFLGRFVKLCVQEIVPEGTEPDTEEMLAECRKIVEATCAGTIKCSHIESLSLIRAAYRWYKDAA